MNSGQNSEIPFGRKIIRTGNREILQCRCDASILIFPLVPQPRPQRATYCHLCNYQAYKEEWVKKQEIARESAKRGETT